MKIGIDARLINETGVGRYTRNLIAGLGKIDRQNSYVVFLKREAFDSFDLPNGRWQKRLADVPWHTVAEQFVMPWLLVKEHLDLVHIPYFNVPIFCPGKFIVTIHDLTILHFDTGKATTLPLPLYKLRRLGYYLALAVGLRRAEKIIAVSQTTKQEVMDHFQIPSDKIVVTYEGVEDLIRNSKLETRNSKPLIADPYFLYVGNAYPHKNLETLLRAFQSLLQGDPLQNKNMRLVLVGKDDFFYMRIREMVKRMDFSDSVIFFGPAGDRQLINLYQHAISLVFPSLMEGFGLPAVEALTVGCPVIVSDIPVFHEILCEAATYFNPKDSKDLTEALIGAVRKPKKGVLHGSYSWLTLASDTLTEYEYCVRV